MRCRRLAVKVKVETMVATATVMVQVTVLEQIGLVAMDKAMDKVETGLAITVVADQARTAEVEMVLKETVLEETVIAPEEAAVQVEAAAEAEV